METLSVFVHVKDKTFTIPCGRGNQKLRWLGDVAILRYSHFTAELNETTKGMRLENGTMLDIDAKINEILHQDIHVWVILKVDLQNMGILPPKEAKSRIVSATNRFQPLPVKTRPQTATMKNSSTTKLRPQTAIIKNSSGSQLRPQTAGMFRKQL